ncbi:hypothetical protein RB614_14865 [Phytohabitans sp. ZYX-F-186]|uniref:Uncharacterized protein n=1 Tax=Phytohabitans maris TaxID=3071409 RepID=A0ABU0ZFN0_9ACTN|nr:hypothetical protein [Phytohabitans sp. ZYX-F-186]MDQ7905798.1 hypothetical protein [Phytohabitans sp. ZYX-F-186]
MTYAVEPAAVPDPLRDVLVASYGWAHFHAFTRLLASEEGIELSRMWNYGGHIPWTSTDTPLRPFFDIDCFEDGRLPADKCDGMRSRLREVLGLWSRGIYAGDADDGMKVDQSITLRSLLAVIDACVETGRSLLLR